MKKLTLIFSAIILLYAAVYASLSIDPFKIEMKADAGTYYKNSWSITNNYDKDIKVEITALDLGSYEGNKNFPLKEWLTISASELIIPKGQTSKVDYRIDISSQMQGSLAAQVSFTMPPSDGGMIIRKMSAPFHVIVRGTEKIDFNVENLTVSASLGSYKFDFSVKNDGNVIIKPQGEISVYKKKKLIAQAKMADPVITKSVFTGKSAPYQIIALTDLKAGKYKAEAKINAYGYEAAKTALQTIEFKVLKDGKAEVIKKKKN